MAGSGAPEIRPAGPADRAALARVAHATGYFGASAERYFPDAELFARLWVDPYLAGVGCCNLVAEAEGAVVGYVVGACDLPRYRRHLAGQVPHLVASLVRGEFPRWRGCLPFLARAARWPGRSAPDDRFPAHLHVNLLTAARGRGVGRALLAAHLDCLARRGVVGVQLSTTTENAAAVALYAKLGFGVWREYESPLWRPWLGRPATHLVMTKTLTDAGPAGPGAS